MVIYSLYVKHKIFYIVLIFLGLISILKMDVDNA